MKRHPILHDSSEAFSLFLTNAVEKIITTFSYPDKMVTFTFFNINMPIAFCIFLTNKYFDSMNSNLHTIKPLLSS